MTEKIKKIVIALRHSLYAEKLSQVQGLPAYTTGELPWASQLFIHLIAKRGEPV